MKTFYHPRGPKIKVTFLTQKGAITSILLHENSQDGCYWQMQTESLAINTWMEAYCEKAPISAELPLIWPDFPSFTRSVLEALSEIPFGKAHSYQELAKKLKNPKAARAVGSACGRNPFPLLVPCHRILGSSSKNWLGGFSCGLPIKKALLNFELIA